MLNEIKELYAHMFWADGIIWMEVKKLPEKEISNRLKELLHHIHSVQYAYLTIWQKKPVLVKELEKFKNVNKIQEWGFEIHNNIRSFLESLNKNILNEPIKIPWTDSLEKGFGKPVGSSNFVQQFFQVVMHSTYHRGQVNKLIREAGGEPPLTDYIYWLWVGKPEGKWELV